MVVKVLCVTFNVIIDDIVLSDGTVINGELGGGGPQTAFGARLWDVSVGLVGAVGNDFPPECKRILEESGVDLQGMRITNFPTLRASQILNEDEQREHKWENSPEVVQEQLKRDFASIPLSYLNSSAFHLGIHFPDLDWRFLENLRQTPAVISIEPFCCSAEPLSRQDLKHLLEIADIFSLTLEEARSITGQESSLSIVDNLFECGAKVVVIRQGKNGALAATNDGERLNIPAYPVKVANPVGAGNSFCGGFVVGWCNTHDLGLSTAQGIVSASLIIERKTFSGVTKQMIKEARRRMVEVRRNINQIH